MANVAATKVSYRLLAGICKPYYDANVRKCWKSKEMGAESKITSKGQTTIPLEVREYLKVGAGDRIGYEFVDGKVVLVPKNRSALEFAGALFEPGRKPVSVEDMNAAIGEAVSERYGRSHDRD